MCAWAGLPEGDAEARLADGKICDSFRGRAAEDEDDDASSTPGSVSVRWTVPLLGDIEPEAKPPPEIVAASAR